MDCKINSFEQVVNVSVEAGKAILAIYHDPERAGVVSDKDDHSPLTLADMAAHQLICERLTELYPDIPVLSEENADTISYEMRKSWERYWLVDPLDGTKEFIKRNGEFTVNIALIEAQQPVMGVVNVPCEGVTYYAAKGQGAYKCEHGESVSLPLALERDPDELVLVLSKSHQSDMSQGFIKECEEKYAKPVSLLSCGSSLKFCMVAEGRADIYPRFVPTMEWDTAAADVVVRESGKQVLTYEEDLPLTYNKPNLLNPFFIVS